YQAIRARAGAHHHDHSAPGAHCASRLVPGRDRGGECGVRCCREREGCGMNALIGPNFQKSEPAVASQEPARIFKFERPDWALFRTVDGLQQKAGVSKDKLRRLVLKELADNGLDAGANVKVGEVADGYYVEDDGSGIDPDDVARLFSMNRPMVSSKLWRLPTRGALGNGLRAVAGAVFASHGKLTVTTR